MKQLEQAVLAEEATFIETTQTILSQDCSPRIRISKLYKEYIKLLVKIDDLTAAAKIVE